MIRVLKFMRKYGFFFFNKIDIKFILELSSFFLFLNAFLAVVLKTWQVITKNFQLVVYF